MAFWGGKGCALWRKVVTVKYGSMEGGWASKVPTGAYGVGLWKYIHNGWDNFSRLLKFEVGDGSRIRFWDDVWCMDGTLKDAFPDLYRLAHVQAAFDWELKSFSSFLELLYSTTVKGSGEDKVCWQPSKINGFQVKSYYNSLSSAGAGCFPWKSI
uniref:Reverse transcriptase zinc-binding domain-containing protein n=1 Tax=Fagus sylvatica TaxID=28930 RepID=A0A2N9G796_FAGSY